MCKQARRQRANPPWAKKAKKIRLKNEKSMQKGPRFLK